MVNNLTICRAAKTIKELSVCFGDGCEACACLYTSGFASLAKTSTRPRNEIALT